LSSRILRLPGAALFREARRVRRTLLVAACCLVGLAGCGGPRLTVEGRLAWNGQTWPATDQLLLQVILTERAPADGQTPGTSFSARVAADGSFTLTGATGHGIPPGSYVLAVRSTLAGPGSGQQQPAWLAALADPATSPLRWEVTADTSERLVIDLGLKTVSVEP
jgi:hypothetical protein